MLFSPGSDVPDVSVNDKLVHATLFAALAFTASLAFRVPEERPRNEGASPRVPEERPRNEGASRRARPLILALALAAYAVLSEILQATLPIHRDGDWRDAVADVVGVAVGLAVAVPVLRRVEP